MKKQKGNVVFALFGVLALAVALILGGVKLAGRFSTETVVATVNEKGERCASRDSCKYMIYTDKGVYQNTDSLLYWKWDSAEVYNDLKVGKTYNLTVAGWRVAFLSWFPNVVEYTEVQ